MDERGLRGNGVGLHDITGLVVLHYGLCHFRIVVDYTARKDTSDYDNQQTEGADLLHSFGSLPHTMLTW